MKPPTIKEFFAEGFAIRESSPHEGTQFAMMTAACYQNEGRNVKVFNTHLHHEYAEAYAEDAGLSGYCLVFEGGKNFNVKKPQFGTDTRLRVEIEIRKTYPFSDPSGDIISLCHRGNYDLIILDSNPSLTPAELKAIHGVLGADILAINHTPTPK